MAETTEWEKLRSRARYLESEIERALPDLTSLVKAPSASGSEESRLSSSIEGNLKELGVIRDAMAVEVERSASAARTAVLQRCREILSDFESEFKRASKELKTNNDRKKLFCGANVDDPESGEGGEHMQKILKERKHVGNAMRGVGDVIEQAHEAKADLAAQRQALEGSNFTMANMTANLPTIDGVIQAMREKKTRHNAIIGVTIGCCSSFLLWAVLT